MIRSVVTLALLVFLNASVSTTASAQGGPRRQEPECVEPVWPMPEGAADIQLPQTSIGRRGERFPVSVTVKNLKLLQDKYFAGLGPLLLIVENKTPEAARFEGGGGNFLEHKVDPSRIGSDGSYTFTFQLVGGRGGVPRLLLGWKWRILTEGACSTAINGVYAGCWIGGQLNKNCVCQTLADMPAPGSWACKAHPLTFRAVWSLWGCPGASPY